MILSVPLALVVVVLLVFQDDLIYFPRHYPARLAELLPPGATMVGYRTGQGEQTAFYCPPRSGGPPERLWLLFGGNGALALDWRDLVAGFPDPRAGFLLVDYPGYGRCAGKPSPARIGEASATAFAALAPRLGETVDALARRSGVLGHSLGAAAACQFAARQGISRVVLVSPFTDLRAMARGAVGWPLCWLLRGNFDNRARLAELVARDPAARVAILHGGSDEVIPVAMGRELAAGLGPRAIFIEIPGADHNGILAMAETEIFAAMAR